MRSSFAALLLTLAVVFVGCKKDKTSSDEEVVTLDNPTDGQIVLSSFGFPFTNSSRLLILDKNGSKLFEKSIPVAAVNFKKWTVNGRVRYTYLQYDTTAFNITSTGSVIPGYDIILNENFQEIKRVKLLPYNGRTASDPSSIDGHEFIYLDDNHFITLSYFQKPVNNIPASLNPLSNCLVVAPIIQEIQNDAVVWEWDGTQYPEFYTQSIEGNLFSNAKVVHDYIHMNSVIIDPADNNLICSLRHLNQIIKISHTDGHIIWRLGGTNSTFPMTADMKFLRQHHATLTDNNQTLLLIDNGDSKERAFTRIMEFRFTSQQASIASYKAFTLPNGIFAQYMGSAQKRGDTYFIGCGSKPKIMEVNYVTNKITFEMNLTNGSYRALKD